VPKVSLLELCFNPTCPEYVFGKQATGNVSTRSSRCRCAAKDGGGIRSCSLGVRKAWTVYTGSGFGGWTDWGRLLILDLLLQREELDDMDSSELAGLSSRVFLAIVGRLFRRFLLGTER
jgi:hypothetical protein